MYASKGKILKTMFLLFKNDIKISTFDLIFTDKDTLKFSRNTKYLLTLYLDKIM